MLQITFHRHIQWYLSNEKFILVLDMQAEPFQTLTSIVMTYWTNVIENDQPQ